MKKLFLTITTLFLGLFTIASCDINHPKPDKVKETETTQGNEKKEDNTDKKKEDNTNDKTEDKDKEKENTNEKVEDNKENTVDKEKENTEEKDKDKEKEPTTNDNGTTSNDGTTSNEVGSGETGTNEKEPTTEENGSSTNEVGGSSESGSSESGTTNGEEPAADGRPTPEETARFLAFNTKRVEIKKRLDNDRKLDNSPEGIELARTIAPNWDMRYKTDLMGRPVDEFYLVVGTIERDKMRATSALNYGWQRISEERG